MKIDKFEKIKESLTLEELYDLAVQSVQRKTVFELKEQEEIISLRDNDILGIGKYRYYKLIDVPAFYLLNLYNHDKTISKALFQYISDNLERLEKENKGEVFKHLNKRCRKLAFEKESAEKKLKEILKDTRAHVKPTRSYKCNKCGLWHLTKKIKHENRN